MAIKPDFRAVVAQYALQPDGFVGRRQRVDGLARVELASAFAADHEVAILLLCARGVVGRRGDPRVHDDQCALRRGQAFEHVPQVWRFRRHCRQNILERRTNPLPSSTSPRVTSGQSERFSFERPWAALGLPAAASSKYVLVRS